MWFPFVNIKHVSKAIRYIYDANYNLHNMKRLMHTLQNKNIMRLKKIRSTTEFVPPLSSAQIWMRKILAQEWRQL